MSSSSPYHIVVGVAIEYGQCHLAVMAWPDLVLLLANWRKHQFGCFLCSFLGVGCRFLFVVSSGSPSSGRAPVMVPGVGAGPHWSLKHVGTYEQ